MPCSILWIFSPIEIGFIIKSINRKIPRGFLNISKLILTVLLINLSAVDLIIAINQNGGAAADYCTPAIKIITFVSKKKQRVSKGVKVNLFWGNFDISFLKFSMLLI